MRGVRQPIFVLLLLWGAACALPSDAEGPATEVEFGLGDKADGGGCDPRAPLCWPREDGAALRSYMSAQDTLLVGAGDDGEAARTLVRALDEISHKLEPTEADALPALRARAASLGSNVDEDERIALVLDVHEEAAERIATMYFAAHAVPLGASADDSADEGSSSSELPRAVDDPDVIESLAMLRESGPFGYVYALMIEHTGVLNVDARVWDEDFPFSEPREQRVERIVDRYTNLSTRDEVISNLESLIPYAGIPLSIGHSAIAQFRHRMRMGIEIAGIYGIDVREGQNLLLVTGTLMGTLEIPGLRGLFGGIYALPALARLVVRVGRVFDPRALLRQLMRRLIDRFLAVLFREGAELTARVAARSVAVGVSRQVLGYATLGLAMIGDVLLTRALTRGIGEHLEATMHPWGVGMLEEDGALLLDGGAACIADALGGAMGVDGEIHPDERALLTAHLSRRVWQEGRWRSLADITSLRAQADDAAYGAARGSLGECFVDDLHGGPRRDRLAALSWVLTMLAIDGELTLAEQRAWGDAVDALRGDAWFGDGEELEEAHLDAMRARIEVTLVSPEAILDDETLALLPDLDPAQLVDRFDEVDPFAERAVACAFDGC